MQEVIDLPEPTEFTAKCRALIAKGANEAQWEFSGLLLESCVIIEQLEDKYLSVKTAFIDSDNECCILRTQIAKLVAGQKAKTIAGS